MQPDAWRLPNSISRLACRDRTATAPGSSAQSLGSASSAERQRCDWPTMRFPFSTGTSNLRGQRHVGWLTRAASAVQAFEPGWQESAKSNKEGLWISGTASLQCKGCGESVNKPPRRVVSKWSSGADFAQNRKPACRTLDSGSCPIIRVLCSFQGVSKNETRAGRRISDDFSDATIDAPENQTIRERTGDGGCLCGVAECSEQTPANDGFRLAESRTQPSVVGVRLVTRSGDAGRDPASQVKAPVLQGEQECERNS